MARRYWLAGLAAGAVFAADQASKLAILERLRLGEVIPVVDGFFNIVHVRNYGAAFGFLNRADTSWQTWFFVASSIVAVGVILWLLAQADDRDPPLAWGLGLVLGGAMGNLLDRLRLGNVVDFLDVYWGRHHWPAFNVADAAICVGAGLLLVAFTRSGHVSHPH